MILWKIILLLAGLALCIPVAAGVRHNPVKARPAATGEAARPVMAVGTARPRPKLTTEAPRTPREIITRIFIVTAYCPCKKCCGPHAQGILACGLPVTANGGRFAAADHGVPFGTMALVPGYNGNRPVPVLDRGGAIRGDHLDLFFPTHGQALAWGRKTITVQIQS